MKQKYIDALYSVVLHYNDEAKHDLIEYLEEEGYTHYGTDMEFSDLSSEELYDYCITQDIGHIWVSLWELGGLHDKAVQKEVVS